MFERDKAELRDLGIPLETGRNSALRQRGRLPHHPRRLRAAADRVRRRPRRPRSAWRPGCGSSATLGEPARSALIKLRAAGTDVQDDGSPGAVPHARHQRPEPAGADRRRARRPVRCASTTSSRAPGPPQRRTLEPWGVLSWRRRWYVAGLDRDRRRAAQLPAVAHRRRGRGVRRAGRVRPVPPHVDLLAMVSWPRARRPSAPRRSGVTGTGARRLRRIAASESDGRARRSASPICAGWRVRWRAPVRRAWCSTRPISSTQSSNSCARTAGTPRAERAMSNEQRLPRLLALVPVSAGASRHQGGGGGRGLRC